MWTRINWERIVGIVTYGVAANGEAALHAAGIAVNHPKPVGEDDIRKAYRCLAALP
jgi:hypothetical protein